MRLGRHLFLLLTIGGILTSCILATPTLPLSVTTTREETDPPIYRPSDTSPPIVTPATPVLEAPAWIRLYDLAPGRYLAFSAIGSWDSAEQSYTGPHYF